MVFFAYNEVPTIAVAMLVGLSGASQNDAPFFMLEIYIWYAQRFNSIT
jgi:hypothetical protein